MESSEVILHRTLWLSGDGAKHAVVVRIGRPYPIDDGQNYVCPFEIDGINATSLKKSMGVDSIQALWLALNLIGASLYASAEYKMGRLRWFEDQDDLGFPQP
jgi:hypothetical protein